MKTEKLQIISTGEAHWKKGYDIAIKTCYILKVNKINFEYKIIGAKKSEEVLFLCNVLNLTKEVKLMDILPYNQMMAYIKESDIFLQTNILENAGNNASDAMRLNTFVIATNTIVNTQLITNGKEGFIVPILNAKKMAQKIVDFNDLNEIETKKIRKRAFEKVGNQFTTN